MRRAMILLVSIVCLTGLAHSDPAILEGGVFIAHYPRNLQYTNPAPPEGWCQHYLDNYAIETCEDQVNRIDTGDNVVWFILVAWAEDKQWRGAEFGFGTYHESIFSFSDHGACFPVDGLELPSAGWPGPDEGIALTTTTADWSGNLQPVYYFAGYAYSTGVIPLGVDPTNGFGGTCNCHEPPQVWEATAYGGMGLFTNGVYVCPGDGGSAPLGQEEAVCCIDEQCAIATGEECEAIGGAFYPGWTSCTPNPCRHLQPEGAGEKKPWWQDLVFVQTTTTTSGFMETLRGLRADYGIDVLVGMAPNGIICRANDSVLEAMSRDPRVALVTREAIQDPGSGAGVSHPADPVDPAALWNLFCSSEPRTSPPTGTFPYSCTQVEPNLDPDTREPTSGPVYDETRQTSVYMIGDVGVKVIFVEGNDTGPCPIEDWTTDEITWSLFNVEQGLAFLADYSPDNNLSFVMPESHSISYYGWEPIQGPSGGVSFWGSQALAELGFDEA